MGWAVACAALGLAAASAEAAAPARSSERPGVTRSAAAAMPAGETSVEVTSSIGAAAPDERPCERSRKRLWVEGEGWVVRKVATCY
jgi:hypothetical protein